MSSRLIELDILEGALRTFTWLASTNGFVAIVSYTPSAYTAYAQQVVFEDPALDRLMPSFSRTQRQFLEARGRELGYLFFDLSPHLQSAAAAVSEELLYYRRNLHLTERGHRTVAEALGAFLQQIDRGGKHSRGSESAGSAGDVSQDS